MTDLVPSVTSDSEEDVVEATKNWTKKKLKRQNGAGERLKK